MAIKTTAERERAAALINALRMELPDDVWQKDPEIKRLMQELDAGLVEPEVEEDEPEV